MDATWKATVDGYMMMLYDGNPQGKLLESIKDFESRLIKVADKNEGNMDIPSALEGAGLQDEYNQLYMAVVNRNYDYSPLTGDDGPKAFDASKVQRVPTVHEFLDSYRVVYEQIRSNNRETTNAAYEKLFEVEERTDDLIEAQMIIEKEQLILNTVIADYKDIAKDFLDAADPNYEVTSATTKATIGVYATAKSIDEITYMGEVAYGTTADIAVQVQLKVEMVTLFMSLIFAWERAKRKIREGGAQVKGNASAMVVTRAKMRSFYKFMSEDMGITFDVIEKTPFYRIMLLFPSGLDELWRIKKVMHPGNIEATKYVLFEEILSDKSMEEILMTPQKAPYYEMIDTNQPGCEKMDEEFLAIAEDLNKDIKYFQRNRTGKMDDEGDRGQDQSAEGKKLSAAKLMNKTRKLEQMFAQAATAKNKAYDMTHGGSGGAVGGGMKNMAGAMGSMKGAFGSMSKETKKEMGKEMAKGVAAEAAKDVGRSLLRGLLKR